MLQEIATHEIVLVAESPRQLPRSVEQQARILDAAETECEVLRAHVERLRAPIGAEHRVLDASMVCVELEINQVRVHEQLDQLRGLQLVVVLGAEARDRMAEAEAIRRDAVRLTAEHIGRLEVRRQIENVVGLGGVGVEIHLTDRPATERMVWARDKVVRIERPRPAAPVIRGAAEVAQACAIERKVRSARTDAALVELLRFARRFEASALEQTDAAAERGQTARERDPGGTGADHAHVIALMLKAILGAMLGIEDHALPTSVRSSGRITQPFHTNR